MIESLYSRLPGITIVKDVPLAQHTSFGIGGPAAGFVEVSDIETFAGVLKTTGEFDIDTLVIGGGTNLLVSDEGFDGLAIKMNFSKFQVDEDKMQVTVGAGVLASELVERLIEKGLGGMEFAAGLPGTVGGAIAGNAGCFGSTLSDFMVSATVIDPDGNVTHVTDKAWFAFDYRHSTLNKTGSVLTQAVFRTRKGDKNALLKKADECLKVRREKHPQKGAKTAGSYFKNLPPLEAGGRRRAAGSLLDQAGAHGLTVGDAAVFERHANIIVNLRSATAKDVLALAQKMAGLVKSRFGVTLEPEVRWVGKRPENL